ncbi:hypothetical protein DSECCO2_468670 [anaerobic digester metagenome]
MHIGKNCLFALFICRWFFVQPENIQPIINIKMIIVAKTDGQFFTCRKASFLLTQPFCIPVFTINVFPDFLILHNHNTMTSLGIFFTPQVNLPVIVNNAVGILLSFQQSHITGIFACAKPDDAIAQGDQQHKARTHFIVL